MMRRRVKYQVGNEDMARILAGEIPFRYSRIIRKYRELLDLLSPRGGQWKPSILTECEV
jgi:hypothetical protein